MDQKDFYNQLKNAFLLGNYHKVFEFLKTYSLEEQHLLYKDEICSLIVRSFLALEDRQTPEMETLIESNTDIKTVHDILYPFLHVLLYGKENDIEKLVRNIEEKPVLESYSQLGVMIEGYIGLRTLNYKLAKQLEHTKQKNELEMLLILILLLIKMNQISLAEGKQRRMSHTDDEDLATHLAHIYLLIFQGKLEDAAFLIDETKEKFQDSLKLLNLKAACLIALKQYDNAKVLLEKLLNILTNKEQYKDRQETQICLNNLIVLNLVQGLPYEEYLKQLPQDSIYVTKYTAAANLFDKLILLNN